VSRAPFSENTDLGFQRFAATGDGLVERARALVVAELPAGWAFVRMAYRVAEPLDRVIRIELTDASSDPVTWDVRVRQDKSGKLWATSIATALRDFAQAKVAEL